MVNGFGQKDEKQRMWKKIETKKSTKIWRRMKFSANKHCYWRRRRRRQQQKNEQEKNVCVCQNKQKPTATCVVHASIFVCLIYHQIFQINFTFFVGFCGLESSTAPQHQTNMRINMKMSERKKVKLRQWYNRYNHHHFELYFVSF